MNSAFNSILQRMMVMTSHNLKSMEVAHETWKTQMEYALTVNGGDAENATSFDYFMHFMTFGWKVLFALIPPPGLLGGWLCFFCSLIMIGLLTAVVGDLAGIFGCLIGLKDTVTAITFVALGTSLPDLFASKAAAAQEKYADNAIGNVTGSNSVNVFLGLGLPWLMAAIYHEAIVVS
jgi:solute carrier family 8 (sodium/calcium exchanger)